MKLRFEGGGLWDGVEFQAESAPEEVRLRALEEGKAQVNVTSAERETVDLSKIKEHVYLLERIDEEKRAIYRFCRD